MKKFVSRLQTMRDRAVELQSMVKQAPTQIADFREALGHTANDLRRAVDVTSDELQHLRSDVEQNLDELRVTDDERLLDSLKQFDAAIPIFREAGYEVGGADIELSPSQRLIVHLNRFDDVPESALQNLAASNTKHPLLHSILKALEQAEAMADRIDLNGLVYYKLLVTIGAVPEVKMCWCPDHSERRRSLSLAHDPSGYPTSPSCNDCP